MCSQCPGIQACIKNHFNIALIWKRCPCDSPCDIDLQSPQLITENYKSKNPFWGP